MQNHDELRQRNRKLRAELELEQLEVAANALAERILSLDEYRQAQRVAAYFAVNGEIGLAPLIDRINKFRLPEPDVDEAEMLAPDELDLVLAPLVVFDSERNRIGMGGGFYDRSFAFRKRPEILQPMLIGVAHELQKVERIVPQEWDVRLDMIVTDQAVY
jgi:5-formyltetrahydrofolate cyclo-ligase